MNSNSNASVSSTRLTGTTRSIRRLAALGIASALLVGGLGHRSLALESAPIEASQASNAVTALKAATKNRQGSFRDVAHPTSGSVTVVKDGDKPHLLLSGDFKTDSGPALEIIFYSESTVPTKIEGKGEYFRLAKLRKVRGSDRYALPENFELGKYQSVAIWCEEFDVTFGYAPLQ